MQYPIYRYPIFNYGGRLRYPKYQAGGWDLFAPPSNLAAPVEVPNRSGRRIGNMKEKMYQESIPQEFTSGIGTVGYQVADDNVNRTREFSGPSIRDNNLKVYEDNYKKEVARREQLNHGKQFGPSHLPRPKGVTKAIQDQMQYESTLGTAQPVASPIDYALLGAGQGVKGMLTEGLMDVAGTINPALGFLDPRGLRNIVRPGATGPTGYNLGIGDRVGTSFRSANPSPSFNVGRDPSSFASRAFNEPAADRFTTVGRGVGINPNQYPSGPVGYGTDYTYPRTDNTNFRSFDTPFQNVSHEKTRNISIPKKRFNFDASTYSSKNKPNPAYTDDTHSVHIIDPKVTNMGGTRQIMVNHSNDPNLNMTFKYDPIDKTVDGVYFFPDKNIPSFKIGRFLVNGLEKVPAGTILDETSLSGDSAPNFFKAMASLNKRHKAKGPMYEGEYMDWMDPLNDYGETTEIGKLLKEADEANHSYNNNLRDAKLSQAKKLLMESFARMKEFGVIGKDVPDPKIENGVLKIPSIQFTKNYRRGGFLPRYPVL